MIGQRSALLQRRNQKPGGMLAKLPQFVIDRPRPYPRVVGFVLFVLLECSYSSGECTEQVFMGLSCLFSKYRDLFVTDTLLPN